MTDMTIHPPAPRWNLSDLFDGPDDPRLAETLAQAQKEAEQFAQRFKGRLATLADVAADELAHAIATYESIHQSVARAGSFASLLFAADTNEANGAFYQRVRETITRATLPLLFFELELMAAPPDKIAALQSEPVLARYRHYLDTVRVYAPFRLSEAEERVLEEQANTGRRAFIRLYEEITSNLRFAGKETSLTLSEVLDLQHNPDRDTRKAAADALTTGLEPHARTLAYLFNTLLQDKATDDRLRGYAYQEQARHLANELTPEIVETVVGTAVEGYGLVARYYHAKKPLLRLDKLAHYDRYAPVLADEPFVSYDDARRLVLTAFGAFDPGYRDAAQAFFQGGWIDAQARPGKRGGAFCSYVTPDTHPYVFLHYLGKSGDVRTLAHELGHGVHSYLARPQGYLSFHGTLPMAEVASTFAEMLVFDAQLKEADDSARLAAYAHQAEQAIATIFRQATLFRFEQAIHRERRQHGELSVQRFGQLWQEHNGAMFGDSVMLEPGHALWWSYVRHFVATPFYVYAYTFGQMLALALYRRYQESPAGFAPRYVAMLAAGGSQTPAALLTPLGVDLADKNFWRGALDVLEMQVAQFERLAACRAVAQGGAVW